MTQRHTNSEADELSFVRDGEDFRLSLLGVSPPDYSGMIEVCVLIDVGTAEWLRCRCEEALSEMLAEHDADPESLAVTPADESPWVY